MIIFSCAFLNAIPSTFLRSLLNLIASTASYAETSPSPITTTSAFVFCRNTSGIEPATELPTITQVFGLCFFIALTNHLTHLLCVTIDPQRTKSKLLTIKLKLLSDINFDL